MSTITKIIIAFLVVIALAEVMPEAVNAVLILILIGILLMRWPAFAELASTIGSIGQ